jgi:ferritin-like metal-binding protein YciE
MNPEGRRLRCPASIEENATPEMENILLIAAAQRMEHYEMAGYTSACSLAKALGFLGKRAKKLLPRRF